MWPDRSKTPMPPPDDALLAAITTLLDGSVGSAQIAMSSAMSPDPANESVSTVGDTVRTVPTGQVVVEEVEVEDDVDEEAPGDRVVVVEGAGTFAVVAGAVGPERVVTVVRDERGVSGFELVAADGAGEVVTVAPSTVGAAGALVVSDGAGAEPEVRGEVASRTGSSSLAVQSKGTMPTATTTTLATNRAGRLTVGHSRQEP